MSQILGEVLEANRAYAQSFGKKSELALPPARGATQMLLAYANPI